MYSNLDETKLEKCRTLLLKKFTIDIQIQKLTEISINVSYIFSFVKCAVITSVAGVKSKFLSYLT